MNTATHPVAPEEIMALLDGELSAERAQSITAHIDQCAQCDTFAKELRTSSHNLKQWEIGSLPSSMDESPKAVTANPSANSGRLGSSIFYRSAFWNWKQWTLGLSTAAVAVILLLIVATPNLLRSRMAANEASEIGRARAREAARGLSVDKAYTDSSKVRAGDALQESSEEEHLTAQLENHQLSAHHAVLPHSVPRGGPQAPEPRLAAPMIARTVSLSIVVKDFEAGRASLDAILARYNGYAAGLNVATPQRAARTLQASLRIPAPQLAPAIAELKALGRVEMESQNGEEVTQQHADLVARLKNSRETEQRLQDVLRTRTGRVKDILEVEEEIARVRGEIEQMEAEQKTLEHRVNFSTIELKLAEEYKAQLSSPTPSVAIELRNATVNGFRSAAEGLLGIILFFAESGPTLVLWLAILLFPARMLWRRYQRIHALGTSI